MFYGSPLRLFSGNAILDEGQSQHWLHSYFNSKLDGVASQVVRPNLHLVIALDISGSMAVAFAGEVGKSKIQIAQQSLLTVLRYSPMPPLPIPQISDKYPRQLRPEDSFGLVLFNEQAKVIQELCPWKDIDALDLEKQIMKFRAGGGTSIVAAMDVATKMFTTKETER